MLHDVKRIQFRKLWPTDRSILQSGCRVHHTCKMLKLFRILQMLLLNRLQLLCKLFLSALPASKSFLCFLLFAPALDLCSNFSFRKRHSLLSSGGCFGFPANVHTVISTIGLAFHKLVGGIWYLSILQILFSDLMCSLQDCCLTALPGCLRCQGWLSGDERRWLGCSLGCRSCEFVS